MTKTLKIVGIIFLVTAILFGGTYLTIHLLNKKTEQYEVFADSKVWSLGVAGKSDGIQTDELSKLVVEDSRIISSAVSIKYHYLKPYFSTVGVNASQKKQLKKLIDETTINVATLEDYIKSFTINPTRSAFYIALLPNYIKTINSQVALTNLMQEILIENEVQLKDDLLLLFSVNDVLVDVAINSTFKSLEVITKDGGTPPSRTKYIGKNSFISGDDLNVTGNQNLKICISNVNLKISAILSNNDPDIDAEALFKDASYNAYKSTIIAYNEIKSTMTDEELTYHFNNSKLTQNGKTNEKVESANALYSRLINICTNDLLTMKISPFDATTQQISNNLALIF